jgi:hypothetical protein
MAYDPDRYRNDAEFRERRKKLSKAYYDKVKDTPEFKAKNYARICEWRSKNKDKVREYRKTDTFIEYRRKYQKEHPYNYSAEQIAERNAKAKAKYHLYMRIVKDAEFAKTVDPELKDKALAWDAQQKRSRRKYYANNRTKIREQYKAYREAHLEDYRRMGRESYHRRAKAKALEVNKQIKDAADESTKQ